MLAEVSFSLAHLSLAPLATVVQLRVVDGEVLSPFDLQRARVGAEVDGVAASLRQPSCGKWSSSTPGTGTASKIRPETSPTRSGSFLREAPRTGRSKEHLSYVLPVVYPPVAVLLDVVGRGEEDALAAEAREVAALSSMR